MSKGHIFFRTGIVIFIFCLVSTPAQSDSASKFNQANQAYKDGQYADAIQGYQSIVDSGESSAAVYYNLGNTYVKTGKLGPAVLNYERARQLKPRDHDLDLNYHYALSQAGRLYEDTQNSVFQKMITGHIQFYTVDEMLVIMTLLLTAVGFLIIAGIYFKWPLKYRIWGAGVLGGIFLIFLTGFIFKLNYERNRAIVIQPSSAYFEPNAEATVHYTLDAGAQVYIIQPESQWLKIKRKDGKLGWVPVQDVEQVRK